jgi:hypothetical protein
MAITTLQSSDSGSVSRTTINDNFTDLDTTKADIDSPAFTGTPSLPTGTTAVTQSPGDNSTKVATTAYADNVTGAAKLKVRAYKTGSNQTISTSFVKVTFETESFDTGNNFASSTFIAPRTGYYLVSANGRGTTSGSGERSMTMAIYVNGAIASGATAGQIKVVSNAANAGKCSADATGGVGTTQVV